MGDIFMDIYEVLREEYGDRDWWPARSPFEVMVGAVLTQNTNWQNVEKAIDNLRDAGLLEPVALIKATSERLQERIRPAGYYRQKSARVQRLARWVADSCPAPEVSVETLKDRPTDVLRRELLAINGIGPETADSILLYALDKPVFVVDAYTVRVFGRHGLIDPSMPYAEVQETFQYRLPEDIELYRDYHAQIVEVGKRCCSKSSPECSACPLKPLLGPGELR
ncbi:MAG: endonuclease III domain-containing protein [Planctomycetota bacterium]